MPTVEYTTPYPNCPISDPCGLCRLLKDGNFEIAEEVVSESSKKITLKKVREKTDTGVKYNFPINVFDKEFIQKNCVTAVITSCPYGRKENEGTEIVSVTDVDLLTGELVIKRDKPLIHTGKITINFGVVTVPMINKMLDALCEMYESVCGQFPPFATRTVAGIGKASAVAAQNLGKPPTFITTDDANWQMVIAALGSDLNQSTLGQFISFLETETNCNGTTKKNMDILQGITASLCGNENCFTEIINALCGAIVPIKSGENTIGIQFDGVFVTATHGIKPTILASEKRVGAVNTTQDINYVSPANSPSGTVLESDFTGSSNASGVIKNLVYDTKNITLPRRGRLRIQGQAITAWNQGLTIGKIVIKSGSVVKAQLTSFLADQINQTRGSAYTNITSPLESNSIFELTDILEKGEYSVSFEVDFALKPTATTTQRARIYSFSHDIQFIPEI